MPRKTIPREHDALVLLARDHDAIRELFREYHQLMKRQGDHDRKAEVVGEICMELSIHLQIEEEIFHPAVRTSLGPDALMADAVCEHVDAKELIATLDELEPGDAGYDTTVVSLCACVVPHMNEEQEDVFPKVRMAGLDTAALGRQLAQRQKTLHEDVTRVGLPHSRADASTWPAACRVVLS